MDFSLSFGCNGYSSLVVLPSYSFTTSAAPTRPPSGVTVKVAVEQCLAAKQSAGLRPRYIRSLRQYLTQFSRWTGDVPIEEIDVNKVEDWFQSRNEAPATRHSNGGRLGAVLSFAERRGWIDRNPLFRLERVRIIHGIPFIFDIGQCRRILEWTREHKARYVAFLALSLFCGIRPEELEKLTWDRVDLDEKIVTIDATMAKTRRRRIVHLPENACAWLRLGGDLPIHHTARRRWERRTREMLGLGCWPKDSLRHTAASMMLARDRNASLVATELGNSPGILAQHYIDLVPESVAKEFWAIKPE